MAGLGVPVDPASLFKLFVVVRFLIKVPSTKMGALFIPRLQGILVGQHARKSKGLSQRRQSGLIMALSLGLIVIVYGSVIKTGCYVAETDDYDFLGPAHICSKVFHGNKGSNKLVIVPRCSP